MCMCTKIQLTLFSKRKAPKTNRMRAVMCM